MAIYLVLAYILYLNASFFLIKGIAEGLPFFFSIASPILNEGIVLPKLRGNPHLHLAMASSHYYSSWVSLVAVINNRRHP